MAYEKDPRNHQVLGHGADIKKKIEHGFMLKNNSFGLKRNLNIPITKLHNGFMARSNKLEEYDEKINEVYTEIDKATTEYLNEKINRTLNKEKTNKYMITLVKNLKKTNSIFDKIIAECEKDKSKCDEDTIIDTIMIWVAIRKTIKHINPNYNFNDKEQKEKYKKFIKEYFSKKDADLFIRFAEL